MDQKECPTALLIVTTYQVRRNYEGVPDNKKEQETGN